MKAKVLALACWGFCFFVLDACNGKQPVQYPIIVPVENPYPFKIDKVEPYEPEAAKRRFSIQAQVGEALGYFELFEKYGFGGNGPSWVEHIQAILAEKAPDLEDHLEFDEEADTFLVYADSKETVNRFMYVIHPVFSSKENLKQYLSHADPDNFSE